MNLTGYGAVQCYICVWMTNFEGRFPEVDNCRTGKLDTATVVSDSCPYGCHVTIIHEYGIPPTTYNLYRSRVHKKPFKITPRRLKIQ